MNYQNNLLDIDERGVAFVTLNRPHVHNAMSAELIQEMQHICATIESDNRVRVVVLSGAGETFVPVAI